MYIYTHRWLNIPLHTYTCMTRTHAHITPTSHIHTCRYEFMHMCERALRIYMHIDNAPHHNTHTRTHIHTYRIHALHYIHLRMHLYMLTVTHTYIYIYIYVNIYIYICIYTYIRVVVVVFGMFCVVVFVVFGLFSFMYLFVAFALLICVFAWRFISLHTCMHTSMHHTTLQCMNALH